MHVPTTSSLAQKPDRTYETKKSAILARLAVPDQSYSDLSPKGSIDAPIRPLISEINALSGYVTTSSCSGRLSVFVEGTRKRAASDAGGQLDEQEDAADAPESPSKRARTASVTSPSPVRGQEGHVLEPPVSNSDVAVPTKRYTACGRPFIRHLKHVLGQSEYPEDWATVILREHHLSLVQESLELMSCMNSENQSHTSRKIASVQERKRANNELYSRLISKVHGRDMNDAARAPFLFSGGAQSPIHQSPNAPDVPILPPQQPAPSATTPVPVVILPPLRSPLSPLPTPALSFAPRLTESSHFSETSPRYIPGNGRTESGAKSFREMASLAPAADDIYMYYPRADGGVIRRRIAPPLLIDGLGLLGHQMQLALHEEEHLQSLIQATMSGSSAESVPRGYREADLDELRKQLDRASPQLREFLDERQVSDVRAMMDECLQRTADRQASEQRAAKSTLAGIGGKGGGGHWLFVAHDSMASAAIEKQLTQLTQGWVDARHHASNPGARHHIHFKYEPFILQVLTATPAHAQLMIRHAMDAGFRETGAVSVASEEELTPQPIVTIRTAGLAFGTLLGFEDEADGVRYRLASAAALESMAMIAEERMRENAKRLQRFRQGFRGGVAAALSGGRPKGWEDSDTRRARKREQGLRRARELRGDMSS